MSAYVDRHEVDTSAVGKKKPFEKVMVGFRHYVNEGRSDSLEIAITQGTPPPPPPPPPREFFDALPSPLRLSPGDVLMRSPPSKCFPPLFSWLLLIYFSS